MVPVTIRAHSSPPADALVTRMHQQQHQQARHGVGYSGTTAVVGSFAWTMKVQEDIEHWLSTITDIRLQLSSILATYQPVPSRSARKLSIPPSPKPQQQQQPSSLADHVVIAEQNQQALSLSPGKNPRFFFSNGETFLNFHKQLQSQTKNGNYEVSEIEKSRRESFVPPWAKITDEGNVAIDFFANCKPANRNVPLTASSSQVSPNDSPSETMASSSPSKGASSKSTDTVAHFTFPSSPAGNAAVAAFMPSIQTFIANLAAAATSYQAQNQSFGNILGLNQVNSRQQHLTQGAQNQANRQDSLHGPRQATAAPLPPVYSMPNFEFIRPPANAVFSTKVFLGGVPWDMNKDDMMSVFEKFGVVSIQRPGMEVRLSGNCQSIEKAGYLYLIFDTDTSVNLFLDNCIQEVSRSGLKYFYLLTSRAGTSKKVQVIPWNVSDSTYIVNPMVQPDLTRTVFLGALHGRMNAVAVVNALAMVFGSIEYVSLNTDGYQYPTGSGRAMFTFQKDYASAVKAAFLHVKSDRFEKTITIDQFLEDSPCYICHTVKGSVFCKDCHKDGRYYCQACWNSVHTSEPYKSHQILMKSRLGKEFICGSR